MRFPVVVRVVLLLSPLVFGPLGCGKPDEPLTEAKAEPTPTPTPTPAQDAVVDASEKLKRKTDKAIKSLTGFLHNEDPRFQAKLQKLADKIANDKDKWRKKLRQRRDELQPQIEQLKEQVAKVEGKSKEDVNRQLDALQAQSQNAAKKLSELEGASGEAWKKFKTELKEADAKGDVSKDDDDTPTPSPTP